MGLIEAVLADHHDVKTLFARMDGADVQERVAIFATLRAELVRHEVAEQAIVHPLTGRRAHDGEATRRDLVAEEHTAERILADMGDIWPGTTEWDHLLGRLRAAVLTHAEMEESVELPQLRQRVEADELDHQGATFELVKKWAPTVHQSDAGGGRAGEPTRSPVAALVVQARHAVRRAMST